MKGKKLLVLFSIITLGVTGCSSHNGGNGKPAEKQEPLATDITIPTTPLPETEEVDYQKYFDGLNGGAIFYDVNANKYYIYNQDICEREDSPCSTFKIISTLMGIHENVLTDLDTKMGYDGTNYGMDLWNADLGLKDAFKASCVWYFRKVIDKVGQEKTQEYLDDLNFGNCDISEWNGTGDREPAELNGFWLGSSLKISAVEWVNVLSNIWAGNTVFTDEDFAMLKEVMATDDPSGFTMYGKTGTGGPDEEGKVDNGWYVGEFDMDKNPICFAIHLIEPASKEISGPKAQTIASSIIQNEYLTDKQ